MAKSGGVLTADDVIMIVEPGTLPWDSYLSSTIHTKKHPHHFGSYWQVSHIYDLWFRSFFNDAKIVDPLKPSIIAIRYNTNQLGKLPEKSMKIAYSADEGKTWRILPTSVLDMKNKTVGALTITKGYYMAVAGFGNISSDIVPFKTEKSEVIKDIKKQEKIQKQERYAVVEPKTDLAKPKQKNIFQKIFDSILKPRK